MSEENIQPKVTKDGSHTLYTSTYDEHYHSIHGALQESLHVFIESGLKACETSSEEIRIFEMGLGTGLNALLTGLEETTKPIHYVAVEAIPLSWEQVESLNYPSEIGHEQAANYHQMIHQSPWGKDIQLHSHFTLRKLVGKLEEIDFSEEYFDVFYFDAFAPDTQPELWTEEIFRKLYSWARPGAVWVTYSAKGQVRRNLIAAGWEVEKIPGPPGKREMLRARKPGNEKG